MDGCLAVRRVTCSHALTDEGAVFPERVVASRRPRTSTAGLPGRLVVVLKGEGEHPCPQKGMGCRASLRRRPTRLRRADCTVMCINCGYHRIQAEEVGLGSCTPAGERTVRLPLGP